MTSSVAPRGRPRMFSLHRLRPHGGAAPAVSRTENAAVPGKDAGTAGSTGPLSAVLEAFRESTGTPTLGEIARARGMDPDLVRAAAEHLVRVGRLTSEVISVGCPEGACGRCPLSSSGPGDCAPGRAAPALVALSVRRVSGPSSGASPDPSTRPECPERSPS
jgi:hypothetical protein